MSPDGRRREEFAIVESRTFLLRTVEGASGRRYLLATVFDRNLLPMPPVWTRARIIRLSVFVLGSGIVCYGLAWYLTRPIGRLRQAAQRLAAGDLTARTGARLGRLTDEIGGLARDFDAMAERIEALVTSQRRLLGDISHELRSPLARLRLALELAQRKAGPEAQLHLARIERESERLDELVGQLLALSRLESTASLDATQWLDVATLTQQVATDVDFEAQAADRTVQCRILTDDAHRPILGDAELLRRALENIMRNAVRHTPRHRVSKSRSGLFPTGFTSRFGITAKASHRRRWRTFSSLSTGLKPPVTGPAEVLVWGWPLPRARRRCTAGKSGLRISRMAFRSRWCFRRFPQA
jgi:Signal transduction histidine kinase